MFATGVGVAEDSVEEEASVSSRGGSGRVRSERSGRGLEGSGDVGVVAERWGGQSGSGGSGGIFSLRTSVLSLSFSLVKPMRLRKAFMAHKRRARREEDEGGAGRTWIRGRRREEERCCDRYHTRLVASASVTSALTAHGSSFSSSSTPHKTPRIASLPIP